MYLQIHLFVYLQPKEPRWRAGFKVATTQAMFDFIRGTFDHRNRLYLYFLRSSPNIVHVLGGGRTRKGTRGEAFTCSWQRAQ